MGARRASINASGQIARAYHRRPRSLAVSRVGTSATEAAAGGAAGAGAASSIMCDGTGCGILQQRPCECGANSPAAATAAEATGASSSAAGSSSPATATASATASATATAAAAAAANSASHAPSAAAAAAAAATAAGAASWERFYQVHSGKDGGKGHRVQAFKDRHYLRREFAELMPPEVRDDPKAWTPPLDPTSLPPPNRAAAAFVTVLAGPGRSCSCMPRHRMPLPSINEGYSVVDDVGQINRLATS